MTQLQTILLVLQHKEHPLINHSILTSEKPPTSVKKRGKKYYDWFLQAEEARGGRQRVLGTRRRKANSKETNILWMLKNRWL
jgi:hypothetical protein